MKKISFSNALAIWARENTWTILIITSFIVIELAGRFVNQYQRDWSSFTWPAIGIGFLFSVMTISKLGSENKKINKALTGNRRWIFVITLVVISLFFAYHKLTMLAEFNPLLIASKFLLFSLIVMSIWYVVITLIYFDPITTITMLICGTFGFFFIMIAHEKASPLQMVAGVLGGISAGYLTALFLKRKINQPREDNEEYRLIDVEQSQELIDDMTSLTRRGKFERVKKIVLEIKSLLGGHEFEQTLLDDFWSHVHTFQNNLTNDEPVNPEEIEEVLLDLRIARETLEKMKPKTEGNDE